MIARDAVNFVMRYTVSDTETLRKVHLFMFPEEGPERPSSFSAQDLPYGEARQRLDEFLAAARAQAAAGSAEAAEAVKRLEELSSKAIPHEEVLR